MIGKLRNLGKHSEEMLAAADITTEAQLRAKGAAAAFVAVKRAGCAPSLNLLWAIEGALTGRDWKEVAKNDRLSLLTQVEILDNEDMGTFTEQITINAPNEAVWNVLADIGSICEWNPGVVDSHTTTSGEVGLGSGRRCKLGGKSYLDEKIVEWRPKAGLTMRIIATNLPFETADIRFTTEKRGRETLVTVSPKYTLKFGVLGTLLDAVVVRSRYRKGMINLLKGLKQHVEDRLQRSG